MRTRHGGAAPTAQERSTMQSVQLDPASERRLSKLMLDVLIRAGLILVLAMLCYQIFSPFVGLMAWALILAVTLYPAHQKLARRMGGKQGLAATVLVLGNAVLLAQTRQS